MPYTHDQLSDIQAIEDCAKRYCRGVDRLDPEVMKSAYWPDATDDHGVFVGNAMEFVDMCMVSHLKWRGTMHCIFNHKVELGDDGVSATGEIYNVTYLFGEGDEGIDTWWGRYLDRYEKRGDEWRIIERVCVHEGTQNRGGPLMAIDSPKFRQGDFDRGTPGRPVGP